MTEKIPLQYIADLSCLALEEDEKKALAADMADIIALMDTIKDIDVGDAPITEHISGVRNIMRDDAVSGSMAAEKVLSNASVRLEGCFVVPKLME